MALDDLLDEHEQGERVRSWLRSNALGLIGGVAIGLGAIAGWQWWQGQRQNERMATSSLYSQVVTATDAQRAKADIATLGKRNPTLATLASLQLAKVQVDAGRRDEAIVTLRAAQSAADADLRPVVRQRLASLLVDAGKPAEALPLLDDSRNPAMLEARGDAQLALGQREDARKAYDAALGLIDVGAPQRRVVELKLIEAGGELAQGKDQS